jgi:hypothetical protein
MERRSILELIDELERLLNDSCGFAQDCLVARVGVQGI